jgi:arginase
MLHTTGESRDTASQTKPRMLRRYNQEPEVPNPPMKRRQFLMSAAAALGTGVFDLSASAQNARTYHVLGVPLRAGSLIPGNENDAHAWRDAGLLGRLQAAGCKAVDDGDVSIPSFLPHHSVPPIRSWPAPRIAWEAVRDRVAPLLRQPDQVPLLVGCDCSVVVGPTEALAGAAGQNVHVLYVDGDFDDATPVPARSNSAASCAVWLLTNPSPFWAGPTLRPAQVSVIGWTRPSQTPVSGMGSISLADVRRIGPRQAARQALDALPASSALLLHFDTDVVQAKDLPSAYFPHDEGLSLSETAELLRVFLRDPRLRLIEISEYAALRDLHGENAGKLIQLLADGLKA